MHGRKTGAYKALARKPEGKGPLGKWHNNIKLDLKAIRL
jgi:hypothetical protein